MNENSYDILIEDNELWFINGEHSSLINQTVFISSLAAIMQHHPIPIIIYNTIPLAVII